MMALKSIFIQRLQRLLLWKYKERVPLPGLHEVDYLTMTSTTLLQSKHHNQAKHLVGRLHLGNQSVLGKI